MPIIPGLKILTQAKHLSSLPRDFFVSIPHELAGEVLEAGQKNVKEIGVRWAVQQSIVLLEGGVPSLPWLRFSAPAW